MISHRLSFSLLLLAGANFGCKGHQAPTSAAAPSVAPEVAERKRPVIALDDLGRDRRATLAALLLPQAKIAAALGSYALEAKSKLEVEAPSTRKKTVRVALEFRRDNKGNYHGVKNTTKHYGQEVIWLDGWFYRRLRHSRFIRRRPRVAEPAQIAQRLCGLLPAYIKLLLPFVATASAGRTRHLGREAIKVKLSKAKTPRPPLGPRAQLARRWRRKIAVTSIIGQALLDAKTGAPLRIKLDAAWTFVPPKGNSLPRSGIPTEFSTASVGRMTLSFEQRVTAIGAVARISPPKAGEVVVDVRRLRLEIERQFVTRERPMPSRWPDVSPEVAPPPKKSWRP